MVSSQCPTSKMIMLVVYRIIPCHACRAMPFQHVEARMAPTTTPRWYVPLQKQGAYKS